MARRKVYRGEEATTVPAAELDRIQREYLDRMAGCQSEADLMAEFCVEPPVSVRVVVE